jgi:YD repeat-containing protein
MRAFIAFLILLLLGVAAYASETITYTYDARGRLVQVNHTGTVNNNVVTNYTYDKADNRTKKTTTGSPNPPPP